MILSALREDLRLIRLVVVHNGRYLHANVKVFISVFSGHPNGEGAIMYTYPTSRFIGRSGATKERIIRSVQDLIRLRRRDKFSSQGIVQDSRAYGCLVRGPSADTFN